MNQGQSIKHSIVIVGGGGAGIATAASLLTRDSSLDIAIIEPCKTHYYQPGWTLVGAGVFKAPSTARSMSRVMPKGVEWIQAGVISFEPTVNQVTLDNGRAVAYDTLIICPGLKLDWTAIEGLEETLGKNGVTSNYRYDLCQYTWELVKNLKGGRAVFTQPPMPIKCAGAPQKAMYLSSDAWKSAGYLGKTDIQMFNAGAVLFGVADYVPALMEYVQSYGIKLNFLHKLVSVNGDAKQATFLKTLSDGSTEQITTTFDMLHVVPPQVAPDFIRNSNLSDAAGWVDVDPATLRHKQYANIYGLGDACNTSNAKTAAAARAQAPVVAHNVLAAMGRRKGIAQYNGYGSCPLTVERGKIVLAEFLYAGKLAPSFPQWFINGKRPSRLAWLLKEKGLPFVYWTGMLKGREWMVKSTIVTD
jgi:sulfide:quinone oxidoreductase